MDWLHAVCLGLLQGLTEFLPISSSAHLILVPVLSDWPDQGLAFDVAVHVGTLLAVLTYFRGTLVRLSADALASIRRRHFQGDGKLAMLLVIATIPIVAAGLLLGDSAEAYLREPLVIAAANIGFGILLWVAHRGWRGRRDESTAGLGDALWIGLAQILAIIPGTSRSGITMTAGLFLGLAPTAAARFSFLLAIPTIALAGGWKAMQLALSPAPAAWDMLLLGAAISAIAAYACIGAFLALLERIGMTPFVAYRLVLGAVLLWVFV
ncbi:undecaprenyl-diphosphate phosphatase [Arhodomonas sp. AD133]|uniref:undecaprenyl-diphosphate phosphatase n=1 Tax=Arhodomonas sp. AD133 TaxID=3415009 RepID=UPI003EB7B16E